MRAGRVPTGAHHSGSTRWFSAFEPGQSDNFSSRLPGWIGRFAVFATGGKTTSEPSTATSEPYAPTTGQSRRDRLRCKPQHRSHRTRGGSGRPHPHIARRSAGRTGHRVPRSPAGGSEQPALPLRHSRCRAAGCRDRNGSRHRRRSTTPHRPATDTTSGSRPRAGQPTQPTPAIAR